jgi:hypothetical protein
MSALKVNYADLAQHHRAICLILLLIICDDVDIYIDVAPGDWCQVLLVGPTLLSCANNQLPCVLPYYCFSPVMSCHVAFCWHSTNQMMTCGFPFFCFVYACYNLFADMAPLKIHHVACCDELDLRMDVTCHLWGPSPFRFCHDGPTYVDMD